MPAQIWKCFRDGCERPVEFVLTISDEQERSLDILKSCLGCLNGEAFQELFECKYDRPVVHVTVTVFPFPEAAQ